MYFNKNQTQPMSQVLYIYDALCGWCYGFSPVVKALYEKYQNKITFDVVSGGMITGARVQPIAVMRGYIRSAYPSVESMTGVKFGKAYFENILDGNTYISNSEKPSVALCVIKSLQPKSTVAFAAALQTALYHDGQDLNDDRVYAPLAEAFNLDADQFIHHLNSDAFREKAYAEFRMVKELGVRGFPTLLYLEPTAQEGARLKMLAHGYKNFQLLDSLLTQLLQSNSLEE
jgi:putative protein-disulfide isomerase